MACKDNDDAYLEIVIKVATILFINFSTISTFSLSECSECLTINHKVAGSIPSTSTILNVDYVWKGSTQSREDNWGWYAIEK